MVVTRRQGAGPSPAATSRTSSSTGSQRTLKGKGVDKPPLSNSNDTGAGLSRVPQNGVPSRSPAVGPQVVEDITFDDDTTSHPQSTPPKSSSPKPKLKSKSKKASKTKRRHVQKGATLFDILSRLFLLWLTIYTLSVCPDDVQLRSPVCRALTEYRRLVLEPYVYPPIRAALDHPAVAPHIRRVQPYYNRAVQAAQPLVRRGGRHWRTQVLPRVRWLQMRARPYIRPVQRYYDATLGPYVTQASEAAAGYKLKAMPLAEGVTLRVRHGWKMARPYVRPMWRLAVRVPGLAVRVTGKMVGEAKRQWVDPQVAKIWAAVKERSKAETLHVKHTTVATEPEVTPSVADSSTSSVSSASTTQSESTQVSVPTVPPEAVSTSATEQSLDSSSLVSKSTNKVATPAGSVDADTSSLSSQVLTSSVTSFTSTLDNVLENSSGPSSVSESSVPQPTSDASSQSSTVHDSDTRSVSPETTAPSSSSSDSPSASPTEDTFEDLEGFLSELELESVNPTPGHLSPPPLMPETEETEEEKAERLRLEAIETAEKRADIEARHDQWEIDLEHFGKAQRKVVRATLTRLREAAAEEARAPGGVIRVHVEDLNQEAQKSLKALKAYGRKLAEEEKTEEEKTELLEGVVVKVNKKFGSRIEVAAEAIREWWGTYTNKEMQEVANLAKEVEDLAERAQNDLGFDYAWLGDVSYLDWERYHKLMANGRQFADVYFGMQNGTLANAPANPVVEIMEALQEEVDDMILGFEANLDMVKSAARDSFHATETKKATGASDSTVGSEPQVSILPIEPITAENTDKELPPIFLSRGAEEVEAAASRAEEARTKATREEL